jgi:uncharacterized membrane protein required for colicin V production
LAAAAFGFFGLARGFLAPAAAAFGALAFFGLAAAAFRFGDAAAATFSPSLNEPEAPVPLTCFSDPDLTPRRRACFSCEFT